MSARQAAHEGRNRLLPADLRRRGAAEERGERDAVHRRLACIRMHKDAHDMHKEHAHGTCIRNRIMHKDHA